MSYWLGSDDARGSLEASAYAQSMGGVFGQPPAMVQPAKTPLPAGPPEEEPEDDPEEELPDDEPAIDPEEDPPDDEPAIDPEEDGAPGPDEEPEPEPLPPPPSTSGLTPLVVGPAHAPKATREASAGTPPRNH